MAHKKIKLNGDNQANFNGQVSHDKGVTRFNRGEAVVSQDVADHFDKNFDVTVSDFDPNDDEKLTNMYYYKSEGHDVAKEKENLSLDNVGDAHSLAPRPFSEENLGRQVVNNYDTTVKILNPTQNPELIPDDEMYRSLPVETANEGVEKAHEARSKAAKTKTKKVREAYEGSQPARDEALERGTMVRAPLDNLRAANPAQKEALKANEKVAEIVEMGSEEVAAKNADLAEERTGVVNAEKREENTKKAKEAERKTGVER